MRRTGRSTLLHGFAALAVMAAGVVVVVTDDGAPVASADTVLGIVKDARIHTASGAVRLAVTGQVLGRGEVITTGPHGSAELVTRGRNTLLGGHAALAVVDGSRQQLRTGTAVVDALKGPGLSLNIAGADLAIPHGSATEAMRGVTVRIGALSGPATVTGNTGRRLALRSLSQAVLSGDALPGATTPLHLTDSAHEYSVVPKLVNDDIALKTLARGIDSTGSSTAKVVRAAWTGLTQPVPDRVDRSERVLPMLIADATHGGTAQTRYNSAVAWRAEGGSWGVVLHLLSGRASAVEATLAALQQSKQAPGQVGTATPTVIIAAAGGNTGRSTVKSPPSTTDVAPTTRPGSGSRPGPSGGGTTATPPPDNLLGGLVATVQSVLDGVLGLLPHDSVTADPTTTRVPSHAAKQGGSVAGHKRVSSTRTDTVTSKSAKRTTPNASTGSPETPASTTRDNGLLGDLLGGLLGKK